MTHAPQPLPRAELSARLGLLATPGLSRPDIIMLLRECGSALAALRMLEPRFGAAVAAAARGAQVRERVQRVLESMARHGIDVVALGDALYPAKLLLLGDYAPPLLFVRGRVELLHVDAVAIVGSRNATLYGLDVAEAAGAAAARAGVCVVSGLARGVDATAHAAALEEDGATVAVLGCGVDVTYPRENRALQERIAACGLLVSEFLPGDGPRQFHFPYRNRIIALLSKAVLVVEAGAQSGAMTTAAHAVQHEVPVYCAPNALHEASYAGVLRIHRELPREHVHVYTGMRDLLILSRVLTLEAFNEVLEREDAPPADGVQARLWQALGRGVMTVDDLLSRVRVPPAAGSTALLELELAGRICRLPGQRVRRARRRDRARNRRRANG